MFNPQYKYLNKFFVVGTVSNIEDQLRSAEKGGTSFGTQLTINTGSPSGLVRVRVPNNKNVPNAHEAAIMNLEIGSKVKVGFDNSWLRFEEREGNNGRTYRSFTQFHLPSLAMIDETPRAAGKLVGTLQSKQYDGNKYILVIEQYETNKDGTEMLRNGQSVPNHFTLCAYGDVAQLVHNAPEGSNVECSVRLYNDVVRDDFGDIVDSFNEARIEKFAVLTQTQATPSFAPPQLGTSVAQALYGAPQQQQPSTPVQQFPFGNGQGAPNPFGQQPVQQINQLPFGASTQTQTTPQLPFQQ